MAAAATDWRRSILPAEHGVWGFLAAAALVGLPLGHDLAGCGVLIAATAAISVRQSAASLWLPDRRRAAAIGLIAALGIAGGGLGWSLLAAGARPWLPWLGVALTLAVLHAVLDRLTGRRPWWLSALAGAAFAAVAGTLAVAGGAVTGWAVVAATVLAVHLALTVPLVRAQIRRDGGWARLAIELHLVAVLLATAAWAAGGISALIPLYFISGLARCCLLVDNRTAMSAPLRIGQREMAWLPVLAAAVVVGLRWGMP